MTDNRADWHTNRSLENILAGIGQASYVWDIADDNLHWSENFFQLIGFEEGIEVSSGRGFEKLLSAESQESRFGVVHSATPTISSEKGIPYQCVYAISWKPIRSLRRIQHC